MARVKLRLPESFPFATDLRVRVDDLNYGGHLGNDRILSIIHEARVRFLESFGFTELDIGGSGLIMTDSVVLYLAQAFLGDELRISVTTADFRRFGFDFFYKIEAAASGKEIARAKTAMLFFDYKERKMQLVPEVFLANCAFNEQARSDHD